MGGDFNDFPPGRVSRALSARFRDVAKKERPRCTFPSWRPMLRLDRVYSQALEAVGARTDRSPLARAASDHLPVIVDLDVPPFVVD
jgi:endonuclease/exonuclease/phosphatase family metal-dependent hydrolase